MSTSTRLQTTVNSAHRAHKIFENARILQEASENTQREAAKAASEPQRERSVHFVETPYRPPRSTGIMIPEGSGDDYPCSGWSQQLSKCHPLPKTLTMRVHHREDTVKDYYPTGTRPWEAFHASRLRTSEQEIGKAQWCPMPPGPFEHMIRHDDRMKRIHNGRLPVERKDLKLGLNIVPDRLPPHKDIRARNARLWQSLEKREQWEAQNAWREYYLDPLGPHESCDSDEESFYDRESVVDSQNGAAECAVVDATSMDRNQGREDYFSSDENWYKEKAIGYRGLTEDDRELRCDSACDCSVIEEC